MRSTTIRFDQPLDLVDLGAQAGLVWSNDGTILAGMGPVCHRIPLSRPSGGAEATAALAALAGRDELNRAGSGPLAFAALPFDRHADGELLLPEIVLGADRAGFRWATVLADRDLTDDEVGERVSAALAALEAESSAERGPEPTRFDVRSTLAPEYWRDEILTPARDLIRAEAMEKVVLARELTVATDRPIDLPLVLTRLAATYPVGHLFCVDGFFGASPEQLVSRLGDVVRAHPLAGTAPRSSDPDRDRTLATELMTSDKNRWEHRITISWLLDNLLPFCSYVDAEPEPSIVSLANVHHLGTRVEGRLSSPPPSILELVGALHPTPALGGSPQGPALDLIDKVEELDRGRYGGPTGWVDAKGNGVFAVAIRSAQMDENQIRVFSGVGVVDDSDPEAELAETRAKFSAILNALIRP